MNRLWRYLRGKRRCDWSEGKVVDTMPNAMLMANEILKMGWLIWQQQFLVKIQIKPYSVARRSLQWWVRTIRHVDVSHTALNNSKTWGINAVGFIGQTTYEYCKVLRQWSCYGILPSKSKHKQRQGYIERETYFRIAGVDSMTNV